MAEYLPSSRRPWVGSQCAGAGLLVVHMEKYAVDVALDLVCGRGKGDGGGVCLAGWQKAGWPALVRVCWKNS